MKKQIEITVRGGVGKPTLEELMAEIERWREAADVLSCATPEELEVRLDAILKCIGGLTVANQRYKDKFERIHGKIEALIKYVSEVM